jgi:hypothetical protein
VKFFLKDTGFFSILVDLCFGLAIVHTKKKKIFGPGDAYEPQPVNAPASPDLPDPQPPHPTRTVDPVPPCPGRIPSA